MYVFQRSPTWAVSKGNYKSTEKQKNLFKSYPIIHSLYRMFLYIYQEGGYHFFVKQSGLAEKTRQGFESDITGALETEDLNRNCYQATFLAASA